MVKKNEDCFDGNLFFFLAVIDDNEPFREWTNNRLMPVIDYFSVPLDEKNTGEDNKKFCLNRR